MDKIAFGPFKVTKHIGPRAKTLGKKHLMEPRQLIKALQKLAFPYKLSVYQLLRERSIAQSADYAAEHLDTAMIFNTPAPLWNYAASTANLDGGLILEFGVFKGRSINHFSNIFKSATVHGFDSFEGLAEDWTGYHLPKGAFDLAGKLPKVNDNVVLHKGWFDKTLPQFLQDNDSNIRLCHIDCDTYESSLYVLNAIAKRLIKGSVIVFDEYYGYPNWKLGEFAAWQEVCSASDIKYKYIAFSDMQVAVEIL